ncbi:MAG: hypothetical protein ACKO0Z_13595 [Betaproteobacteria bacterium]
MSAVNGNVFQAVGTGLGSYIQIASNNPPNGVTNRPLFTDITVINNDDGGRQEYGVYIYPSIWTGDFTNITKQHAVEPVGRKLDQSGQLTISNLVLPINYSLVVTGSSYLTFMATTVAQDNVPATVGQSLVGPTPIQLYSNTGSKSANADIVLLNSSNLSEARYQVFMVQNSAYVANTVPDYKYAITAAGRKLPVTSGANITNIMVPSGYSLVAVASSQITALTTAML